MVNNFEHSRKPDSLAQREIELGLQDYEDEIQEEVRLAIEQTLQDYREQANQIIESAYHQGSLKDEYYNSNLVLQDLPKAQRIETCKVWLLQNPSDGLNIASKIGCNFPEEFQEHFIQALLSHNAHIPYQWPEKILTSLDKITNPDLHEFLMDNLAFSILAANKDKFPLASDQEILSKANYRYNKYSKKYEGNWNQIIPHIDKFPTVSEEDVIRSAVQSINNNEPFVLLKYANKFRTSFEAILEQFLLHKKTYPLCQNIKFIPESHHPLIAQEAIHNKHYRAVIHNLKDFQGINYVQIIEEIASKTGAHPANLFSQNLKYLAPALGESTPLYWLEYSINIFPDKVVKHISDFGEILDIPTLTKKLFDLNKFSTIIYHSKELGIKLDESLAMKILNSEIPDEINCFTANLEKFSPLSREVYQVLYSYIPEQGAQYIHHFSGITQTDLYSSIRSFDHNHFSLSSLIRTESIQYLLDDRLPQVLLESKRGSILTSNPDHPYIKPFFYKLKEQLGAENYEKHRSAVSAIISTNRAVTLTQTDLEEINKRETTGFRFVELNTIAEFLPIREIDFTNEETLQEIFSILTEKTDTWEDAELNNNFRKGAEVFGYSQMFKYISVAGDKHDSLYAFDKIIDLQQASQLKPKKFYHNILQQVAMDKGTYGSDNQTSIQKLNSIALAFDPNISHILSIARNIQTIPQLDELLQNLTKPEDVFRNWKILIQYHDLTLLISQAELLDKLEHEPNTNLKKYVATLLFHPSITDISAVKSFWQNPSIFFNLPSSHTSDKLHESKKPSNYTDIPYLDLTPTELRDALINQDLDRIQVWRPLEITYYIPSSPKAWQEYQEFKEQALGSIMKGALSPESKGIRNQKKLFGAIRNLIKDQLEENKHPTPHETATELIQKLVNEEGFSTGFIATEAQEKIKELIYFGKYGYSKRIKTTTYKVKINLKSDPDGVVAGNDTQSCMPFGDGKNTLYTYNPICALMTVQRETKPGEYRTIAQSVLTKDKDIKTSVKNLYEQLSNNTSIASKLSPEILRKEKSLIACDSIEVANNYRSPKYSQLLKNLYQDFLSEYISSFGQAQNLEPTKSIIGSCTYDFPNLKKERNSYLPESPIAYSDKYRENVNVLPLQKKEKAFWVKKTPKTHTLPTTIDQNLNNPNIDFLTFEDTLESAYIENKAYENTHLKQGLSSLENTLIAKDINNSAKKRPNLSLKYSSDDEKMQAYIIAYEGTTKDNDQTETSCIYIMDIAKVPDSPKGKGMELIQEFIQLYQTHYIQKDKLTPILADAREVSSYKLILRHLNNLGESIGVSFTLEEGKPYQSGKDTMYPIQITPTRQN